MGWNQVQSRQVDNPIDPSIAPNSYFYFVHSYHVVPEIEAWYGLNPIMAELFAQRSAVETSLRRSSTPKKVKSRDSKSSRVLYSCKRDLPSS